MGARIYLHLFLTSALDIGVLSDSHPGSFISVYKQQCPPPPSSRGGFRESQTRKRFSGEQKDLLPLPEFKPGIIQPVDWSLYRLRCHVCVVLEIHTADDINIRVSSVTSGLNTYKLVLCYWLTYRTAITILVCKNRSNYANPNKGRFLAHLFCADAFCFWIVSKTKGQLSFPYQLPTSELSPS